jgi:hypothetical protein
VVNLLLMSRMRPRFRALELSRRVLTKLGALY